MADTPNARGGDTQRTVAIVVVVIVAIGLAVWSGVHFLTPPKGRTIGSLGTLNETGGVVQPGPATVSGSKEAPARTEGEGGLAGAPASAAQPNQGGGP